MGRDPRDEKMAWKARKIQQRGIRGWTARPSRDGGGALWTDGKCEPMDGREGGAAFLFLTLLVSVFSCVLRFGFFIYSNTTFVLLLS